MYAVWQGGVRVQVLEDPICLLVAVVLTFLTMSRFTAGLGSTSLQETSLECRVIFYTVEPR